MTATEQNNLTFSKLLNLDSFKLFAFFSTYPGYEALALNEWQGAVGKEEERVVKEKEHKPSFEEEDKNSVFFDRKSYSVLGNFDFIFTCNTREFRSFHRIGITDYIKSFQYLYGYELKLTGGNQNLKAPITAFCEIKIREHILQEASLELILLGFQSYFDRKKSNITFRPYFTIGWIDFIVLIESEDIAEIEKAIHEMQNISFSDLFLDKTNGANPDDAAWTDLTNALTKNEQNEAKRIVAEIKKVKAGHVLTIVHSVFGVPADDFTMCHATCSSKSSTGENIISPMLTLSCMPGHIDYVAENVKNIFNGYIEDDNIFSESGRTTLHLQFNKIPLKKYICGVKRLRVLDVYFRYKQIKETKETKETKKQLAVSPFSEVDCKQFHKDAIENNYDDDFKELKTNLYCQFFHATTTLRQAYTPKQSINAAFVNRQNLDHNTKYKKRIRKLLSDFEAEKVGLLSSFQKNDPCWIKVLTPVKNIINLLNIVSENPLTLYALYEMLPVTEQLLKHLKEYNKIIIKKEAGRLAGGIEPAHHADFVEGLGLLLNDLQLCFNNLYREIFPLSEQVDIHIYYKGAVQKILSSAYGYAFEIWPAVFNLFKEIFGIVEAKDKFAGCFVVSFRNYMAMRDALPGVPVFYMSPETLFKPEELTDIPHEIVHSVFNYILKDPSKTIAMKYDFAKNIAGEIAGPLENEKKYFPFQNELNPGDKELHDEILQEIFEIYFSSARFDKFEGIVAWCKSNDFEEWLKKRVGTKSDGIIEVLREELSFIEEPFSSLSMLIDRKKQQIKELLELVEDTICDSISYLIVGIDDFNDYAFYRLYPLSGIPEEWNDLDVLFYILARLFLVKKVADAKTGNIKINDTARPTKEEFIKFCADIVNQKNWLNHKLDGEKNIWSWYTTHQEGKLDLRYDKWFGRIESIYSDVCRFQNIVLDKLENNGTQKETLKKAGELIKIILKEKITASKKNLPYEEFSKKFFSARSELFLSLWSAEMRRRGVVKMEK